MGEVDKVVINFTRGELWLLHDFIRHECQAQDQWRSPPASRELNEQIRLALLACETNNLREYPIVVDRHALDVIDYHIRADMRTPMASGKDILLKTFKALFELVTGVPTSSMEEPTYKEVLSRVQRRGSGEEPNKGAHDDASS